MIKSKIDELKASPVLKIAVSLIALMIVYNIYIWTQTESTDNAYIEADISVVSSEVNGSVAKLLILDNQPVKIGDIIAEIDDTEYAADLKKADAELVEAENSVKITEQKIEIQKLDIDKLEDNLNYAKISFDIEDRDYKRTSKLAADNFSSKKLLDDAKNNLEKARFNLSQVQFDLNSGRKNLELLALQKLSDEAKVITMTQAKITAEYALNKTKIKAPVDGVVANNNIKIGNYARQGMPLVAVVPITGLYIKANFKETQVEKFNLGAKVKIEIDGVSIDDIEGKVRAIYPASGSKFSLIPPDNATGNFTKVVQRVPVLIDFEIPEKFVGKVKAGMSVRVSVRKFANKNTVVHTKIPGMTFNKNIKCQEVISVI